ncbi:DUF3152 domain-containing protein [Micromonospora sp. WMMD975]|uniref:DUF3152 domain-containing protein n=1 Tax=Micromonospora sp. WMMD975 TaxID=3016087 RepID=UPI00249BC20A|nr:DUF3152 domain-containing protein [Micromonospora sp. WMMD975]WFE33449.1 DUF3152 domain-containing protein [Micromonospora sp. WMMD975]
MRRTESDVGGQDRGVHRRRRRSRAGVRALAAVVVVTGLTAGGGYAVRRHPELLAAVGVERTVPAAVPDARPSPVTARPTRSAPPPVPAAGRVPPGITYPLRGGGDFRTADTVGAVAGRSGELLRYRVAVEDGIRNVDVERFAREVAATLADPRGWTGDGRWRLQRVGRGGPADFTVLLTTPVTRGDLCGDRTDRYTSCRNGDRVVVNVARWVYGVPHVPDLGLYRQYLLNHEVGHRLGRGHERCPRAGGPAPVMVQQTLGLHGCAANAWPLVGGEPLAGPSGQYDDPIPAGDH